MRDELQEMFDKFFNESKKGVVTISYPDPLWDNNKDGVSFTYETYKSPRFKFKKEGILILQTMGYSLVTGKHLYIPYGQIQAVLFEETFG